ncbi:GNAT family N-acetyltransferase [Nocardia xishanensis]
MLRDVRLRALADAPGVFGANSVEAARRGEGEWRARVAGRAQFVAVVSEEVVGAVAGVAEHERGSVHVMSMWVDRRVRGTGVSDRLVEAVVGWAGTEGFGLVRLEVTEGNAAAERLYRRHGFVRSGRSGVIAEGDPRVEFEMVLVVTG